MIASRDRIASGTHAVRDNVIQSAFDEPGRSPGDLAERFTDSQSYFFSGLRSTAC